MWLPVWRRKTNPARSRAARTSRPDTSVGNVANGRFQAAGKLFGSRSLDFDELLACFGRNRIAGCAAVLDVKLNGFTDVGQRLRAGIALADASRQRRHAYDISPIFFLFQNDRIPHWLVLPRPTSSQTDSEFKVDRIILDDGKAWRKDSLADRR